MDSRPSAQLARTSLLKEKQNVSHVQVVISVMMGLEIKWESYVRKGSTRLLVTQKLVWTVQKAMLVVVEELAWLIFHSIAVKMAIAVTLLVPRMPCFSQSMDSTVWRVLSTTVLKVSITWNTELLPLLSASAFLLDSTVQSQHLLPQGSYFSVLWGTTAQKEHTRQFLVPREPSIP